MKSRGGCISQKIPRQGMQCRFPACDADVFDLLFDFCSVNYVFEIGERKIGTAIVFFCQIPDGKKNS